MNIVMLSNTFTPHVGGVARSLEAFTAEYRRRGHRVMVVAPEFSHAPTEETDVLRIPAVQNFNGSDFSVVLPISGLLSRTLDQLQPEIVHAHHPYLLGMTALRIARYRELPLVFTHHTLYEQYTHYVPGDSPTLRQFVIELATQYANLCDQVFAPSESIASLLHERGVFAPVAVVPTGVRMERFAQGDGAGFRAAMGIPGDAFVIGHLGRLAPEKNLAFLAEAVAAFLESDTAAHFLVVGKGPSEVDIRRIFERRGLSRRLWLPGVLEHPRLADAYHAMDAFAFASKTETQGMVLTEAMAAGVPVIALDASGVREIVQDGCNGWLLGEETRDAFRDALRWIAHMDSAQRGALSRAALERADAFSLPRTADKALACYEVLKSKTLLSAGADEHERWENLLHLIKAEWDIVKSVTIAAGSAFETAEAPTRSRPT
jgi:glycosyltransferase involved in cell wall biosynthesis